MKKVTQLLESKSTESDMSLFGEARQQALSEGYRSHCIQEAKNTLFPADKVTSGLPALRIFPLEPLAIAHGGLGEPLPLEENLNPKDWGYSDRLGTRLYHMLS